MEKKRTVRERHPEERRFLEQEKKSAESEKRGGCLRSKRVLRRETEEGEAEEGCVVNFEVRPP